MAARSKTHARRGAAILEMAFIGALLCTLMMTAFDIGRLQVVTHGMETAAYEAARAGASPGTSEDDVRAVATEVMQVVDARAYDVRVSPSPLNAHANQVCVQIEMLARQNLLFLPYNRTIRREAIIQRQR